MDSRDLPQPVLISRPVDVLIGAAGLSLPLMLLVPLLLPGLGEHALLVFPALALICNYPHYWATLDRVFGREAAWKEKRGFLLLGSALMGCGLGAVLAWPALLPPIFTLYLMWSPWHYAGQNYGLVIMLTRRGGVHPTDGELHLLKASFWLSTGIAWVYLHRAGAGAAILWGLELDRAMAARAALGLLICQGVFLQRVLSRWLHRAPIQQLSNSLILIVSQILWFSFFALSMNFPDTDWLPRRLGAGEVAFLHCAQYLWIMFYFKYRYINIQIKEVFNTSYQWILGGIFLWIALPWTLSLSLKLDFQVTLLAVTAFINLHHFMVDGVIWKLREPRVGARLLGTEESGPVNQMGGAAPLTSAAVVQSGPGPSLRWMAPSSTLRKAGKTLAAVGAAGLLFLAGTDLLYRSLLGRIEQPEARALARKLNPYHSSLLTTDGLALRIQGESDAGLQLLRAAVALDPLNAIAWHNLGTARAGESDRSGDREAEACFSRAVSLDARLFEAWIGLAVVLGRSDENGSQAAALEALEKASALRPDSEVPGRIRNRLLSPRSLPSPL